jgi:hypothetical protein
MVSRTTRTVASFSSTFGLPDVDGPRPPGATASTMTRNRSRASPGSRGVASLLSSTYLESAGMARRIRWCRSIPRT